MIYCKLKNCEIVTGGFRRQGRKTEGKFTGIQDLSALLNLTTSGFMAKVQVQRFFTADSVQIMKNAKCFKVEYQSEFKDVVLFFVPVKCWLILSRVSNGSNIKKAATL